MYLVYFQKSKFYSYPKERFLFSVLEEEDIEDFPFNTDDEYVDFLAVEQ